MDLSPSERGATEVLRDAELELLGVLSGASNHTLLVRLVGDVDRFAVYKPQRGERPLWDFPSGTLCRREVAAYQVSDLLGWGLVPPTVLRDGPLGTGSVQQFMLHDPSEHYFTLITDPEQHDRLVQLATFDLLINNADRKGGHVLRVRDPDRLVGIDHGLTFHVQPKLRTVIWEFAGLPIPGQMLRDLIHLQTRLQQNESLLNTQLRQHLSAREIRALLRRLDKICRQGQFPNPGPGRHYPWPPV